MSAKGVCVCVSGGVCPRGFVCLRWFVQRSVCPGVCGWLDPPCGQTDARENITFPHATFAVGNNMINFFKRRAEKYIQNI